MDDKDNFLNYDHKEEGYGNLNEELKAKKEALLSKQGVIKGPLISP
jgi:hypothetical protein